MVFYILYAGSGRCSSQSTDQDFVEITWQIVYSGQTPFKLSLSEVLSDIGMKYNMAKMEDIEQHVQFNSEIICQSSII